MLWDTCVYNVVSSVASSCGNNFIEDFWVGRVIV